MKDMHNKMKLVIDANILMSALIATQGKTYDLIFNQRINLIAPEFLIEEIEKYEEEILEKSGLSDSDLELFLSLISSEIELIPKEEFKDFNIQAKKISPDPFDTEYFALAIKMRCSIWSNDKRLKEQKMIKVYNTSELLKLF